MPAATNYDTNLVLRHYVDARDARIGYHEPDLEEFGLENAKSVKRKLIDQSFSRTILTSIFVWPPFHAHARSDSLKTEMLQS